MEKLNFANISPLDPTFHRALRAIQHKYKTDYLNFFNVLVDSYKGTKTTKELKLASDTISMIKSVSGEIDRLFLMSDVKEIKNQNNKILDLINQTDASFKFFFGGQELSKSFQKLVGKAELETNISAEQMKKTSAIIKGKAGKTLTDEGVISKAGGFLKETGIGEISKKVAFGMAGPLGTIAEAATGAIGGYLQRRREKRISLGERAFAQATLASGETTPEATLGMYDYLQTGGKSGTPKDVFGLNLGAKSVSGMQGLSKGKTQAQGDMISALNSFFSGPAYKAKWTAELLEALRGKATPQAPQGSINGLFSQLSPLLNVLGKILPVLGVLGAGFLGWQAGKAIGNLKIGDKTINEYTQKGFQTVFEGIDNIKREKELNPEIKRALELQEKGVPIAEAAALAHKEFAGEETKEVPVISKESVILQESQKQNTAVLNSLKEIAENSKKKEEVKSTNSSGYDAYNVRDPLLDALNSGSIDIK